MVILGISAFYHDSAACLVKDGKILAAAQEERFSRVKHDPSFPTRSIEYCMGEGGVACSELQNIVFYDKPFLTFERLLETYLAFAPRGFRSFSKSMPLWIKDKLFQKSVLIKELESLFGKNLNLKKKIMFSEHHLSHAASAFYPSPFEKAAVLTLDGVGEWATTSMCLGSGKNLEIIKEIHFPHSLGLLYSAFTYHLGFKVNSGEYKVMGLAPYGNPIYVDLIKDNLIDICPDGSFKLNMRYFDYCTGLTMTNKKFDELFSAAKREPEAELTQKQMDLAASIQKVVEEVLVKLARNIAHETGEKNLCLAGGVALNCVANGILLKEKIFENIWIQPASGDAGGAIGAALGAYHIAHGKARFVSLNSDGMQGSYLGPQYKKNDIQKSLSTCGAVFHHFPENRIIEKIARYLDKGKAIGWMQGRMEFGPRALGTRSIIADPRSPFMQKQLNLKVKFRESFRPFAPSIIFENVNEWFDIKVESPYMLLVASVSKKKQRKMSKKQNKLFGINKLNVSRSSIPAVTHVDYSARVQTVHSETNPKYYKLIKKFNELTGCPIVINTSFNVRGEPIVCSPVDAFNCFMGNDLDILVIENFLMIKEEQDTKLIKNYKDKYELD